MTGSSVYQNCFFQLMLSLSLVEDTQCGLLSNWLTTGHFFPTMMGQDLPDAGKSSAERHLSMLKKCAIMNRQDCSFKKLQLRLVLKISHPYTQAVRAHIQNAYKQVLSACRKSKSEPGMIGTWKTNCKKISCFFICRTCSIFIPPGS